MAKTRNPIWRILGSFILLASSIYMLISISKFNFTKPKKEITQSINQIPIQVAKLKKYLQTQKYSSQIVLLANMGLSMHSKRMYLVNLKTNAILHTCLVSHGSGKQSTAAKAIFSNQNGSYCSSLGVYKIAEKYTGIFGPSYRLDGLDSTNNNARKRAIVFHYYEYQSNNEFIGPHYFSQGCPMLAPSDWEIMDTYLQQQSKPVLLFIYK